MRKNKSRLHNKAALSRQGQATDSDNVGKGQRYFWPLHFRAFGHHSRLLHGTVGRYNIWQGMAQTYPLLLYRQETVT